MLQIAIAIAYVSILQSYTVDSGSYKKIQITTSSFHLSGLYTLHSIEMPLGLFFLATCKGEGGFGCGQRSRYVNWSNSYYDVAPKYTGVSLVFEGYNYILYNLQILSSPH